jgi:hypothetical protein
MSDESSTSVTGGYDPVTTESFTKTIGRPPRKTYFTIQVLGFLVTLGVYFISRSLSSEIDKADFENARWTTLIMKVGELLTTPIGLACAICIVIGLGLLAVRGAIDGILKFLIWANVLWLICYIAYHTMAIWLPLIKAKQAAGH